MPYKVDDNLLAQEEGVQTFCAPFDLVHTAPFRISTTETNIVLAFARTM